MKALFSDEMIASYLKELVAAERYEMEKELREKVLLQDTRQSADS